MATTYTHVAANKRKSLALIVCVALLLGAMGWALDVYSDSGMFFVPIAVVIALISVLVGYFSGDRIALWTAGAHRVTKEQQPYLARMVENLAITAGLPMPELYIIPDDAMNAFATGRDPQHASIAVTSGLIQRLENEELEGVLAHELSHIGNYDIRFMMLLAVLVGSIMLVADLFFRGAFRGRRGRSGGVLILVGLVLLILSPIIAKLIQFAASRKREFLADASGALLTRYPDGLAHALEKIGNDDRKLQRVSNATAPLYLSNPFGRVGHGISRLFSTHPPIEDRISALRTMSGPNEVH